MNALKLEQVTKQFGGKTAVNGIDFEVRPGEILGFSVRTALGKRQRCEWSSD